MTFPGRFTVYCLMLLLGGALSVGAVCGDEYGGIDQWATFKINWVPNLLMIGPAISLLLEVVFFFRRVLRRGR